MRMIALALLLAVPALAQDTKDAGDQFKEALSQARDSKKKVFLTFGSPG